MGKPSAWFITTRLTNFSAIILINLMMDCIKTRTHDILTLCVCVNEIRERGRKGRLREGEGERERETELAKEILRENRPYLSEFTLYSAVRLEKMSSKKNVEHEK